MKKITISQRIIFLSSVLMLTIGFSTYMSYSDLKELTTKYNQIIEGNFYRQELTQEMFVYTKEARINALLSVADGANSTTKEFAMKKIDRSVSEVGDLMSSYDSLSMDGNEKNLLNEAKSNWDSYVLILKKIKSYHQENKDDKVLLHKIVHEECPQMADKLKSSFEELLNFHGANTLRLKSSLQTLSHQKVNFMFIVGILSVVFGLIISFLITKTTKSLLASIVEKVSEVTTKLNSTSLNLSASSQQLASSAQQQASSTEEISSSLEEISGMVSSTIKQAGDSVKLSEDITKLVSQGNEAVEKLDHSVNEIAEANKKVEKLVYLIEEIGQKTEIIDEIVFQTRLLSFNASVEAERAGEHGRGFAVVAQEVGNLAQMSGKSASEISEIVKRSIREAQEVVSLNRSKVVSGVESSKQASEKLKAIYGITKDINDAVTEVLRASEEQNSGIKQINNSIQLISHSTQENATMAEEFHSGSKNLTEQSKKLTSSVGSLKDLVFGELKQQKIFEEENDSTQVIPFPEKKLKVKDQKVKKSKAVGENFHNEDEDHWENL